MSLKAKLNKWAEKQTLINNFFAYYMKFNCLGNHLFQIYGNGTIVPCKKLHQMFNTDLLGKNSRVPAHSKYIAPNFFRKYHVEFDSIGQL